MVGFFNLKPLIKQIKAAYELFQDIRDVDVYAFYLKTKVITTRYQYAAPYRGDNTPSLRLYYYNRKLLWKDMTKELGGDCLGLANQVEERALGRRLDFVELLNIVHTKVVTDPTLLVNVDGVKIDNQKGISVKKKQKKLINYIANTYEGKAIYTKTDLKYWEQGFITPPILIKEKVRSANKVFLQNLDTLENKLIWAYTRTNPIFIYEYLEQGKTFYKGYRPLEKVKERKWLCNFDDSTDILEGYHDLPKTGKVLLITKSKKDYMVFKYAFGYSCTIAVQSENTFMNPLKFQELKDRFEIIILLNDNDKAGIEQAYKYKELYGVLIGFFPRKYGKDLFEVCVNLKSKPLIGNILEEMFSVILTTLQEYGKFKRQYAIYHHTSNRSKRGRKLCVLY